MGNSPWVRRDEGRNTETSEGSSAGTAAIERPDAGLQVDRSVTDDPGNRHSIETTTEDPDVIPGDRDPAH